MEIQTACQNCSKVFPTDKLDLHEAYCFRNIRKCIVCNQFVDNKEIISHMVTTYHQQQYHSNKSCTYCKKIFSPFLLIQHEEICEQSPKLCQFCSLLIQKTLYGSHEKICSSRTQPCMKCGKYVTLKELKLQTHKCEERKQEVREVREYISQRVAENPPERNFLRIDRNIQRIHQDRHRLHNRDESNERNRNLSTNQIRRQTRNVTHNREYVSPMRRNQNINLQAYLSKQQAPCLRLKAEQFSVIIKAQNIKSGVDIMPICLRQELILRDKN